MAAGEDSHGATETSAGRGRAEEGKPPPQRALPVKEPNRGETEGRAPPERSHALNTSGRRGGEVGGRIPTQQRPPTARRGGTRGDPRTHQNGTPLRGREHKPKRDPQPWLGSLPHFREAADIMAKPQQHHNRPDIYEGPGDGATEPGGEGEGTGTGREGGEGN